MKKTSNILVSVLVGILISSCGSSQAPIQNLAQQESGERFCVLAIGDAGRNFHLATLPVSSAFKEDYYNDLSFYSEHNFQARFEGHFLDLVEYRKQTLDKVAQDIAHLQQNGACTISKGSMGFNPFQYHCQIQKSSDGISLILTNQAPGGGWVENLYEYRYANYPKREVRELNQKIEMIQEYFIRHQLCN